MMVGAAHYADHVAPVFEALSPDARGSFVGRGPEVSKRLRAMGYDASAGDPTRPMLVASLGDLAKARAQGRKRIAIMEHGAGQSYGGRSSSKEHGSYAGGKGRGAASLFLHPGPHPAARDRRAYPNARVEIVGSPHLDTLPKREGAPGRVIAVSFHFNVPIAAEARSSYPWIFPSIAALRGKYQILGHGHPRMMDALVPRYQKLGIRPVRDFADVCRMADLYVCDNSSTLFAFAATGRPVVVVNPPWYDRRISHGLRFWEAATVGVNVNRPEDLAAAIAEAFEDSAEQKAKREAALDLVYAYRSGAAKRAADALMDWVQ